MRCPFCIFLLLCGTFWFASCTGPVILEEKEESGAEQENTVNSQDTVAIVHEGTYTSPYTIAEAQTLGHGKDIWVEGYIVGCVNGSMKNGCNYTPQATTQSNILLADTFPTGGEGDYLRCLPVELSTGSIERDDLNLYDNPNNYHQKLRIQGNITLYYKVVGIKNIAAYIFCDEITQEEQDKEEDEDENKKEDDDNDESEPENPDMPYDPDATNTDTLSIAEGIKRQSDSEYNQVYIKGYIIGYTTSNRKIYYDLTDIKETLARKNNVVLSDNIEEHDPDKMIAVELTNGSYIQQDVNLVDNPQNLHRQLTVKGAMKTYKSLYGCIDIPNGLKEGNDTIKDYYFLLE